MCVLSIMISTVLLAGTSNVSGFMSPEPTLTTDKAIYNQGDTVKISGSVGFGTTEPNRPPILIEIFNPDGKLFKSYYADVSSENGQYSYTFTFEGNLAIPGNYEIIEFYKFIEASNNPTVITYIKSNTDAPYYHTFVVPVVSPVNTNQTYQVQYMLTNGNKLDYIDASLYGNNSIELYGAVNSTINHQKLTIELPRKIIDATYNGAKDRNYTVGTGLSPSSFSLTSNFKEIENNGYNRTLVIDLPGPGMASFTIDGTQSVPEFPFAVPILAISLASLLIFYRVKFKF